MHPLFRLEPPTGAPKPPSHWSYSTIKAWRSCPKRWWLERAEYPNVAGGHYPAPTTAAALEGQLVHKVAEACGKLARYGHEPGSVRTRCKLALREALQSLKDNPRVDVGRLAAAVSLDACVAKVHDLTRDLTSEVPGRTPRGAGWVAQGMPAGAEEHWIIVDDPPLKGQLDRVRSGVVTDYKTGAPDPTHADQARFYALLWWLRFGTPPERLELRFMGTASTIPVPDEKEFEGEAAALRSEINAANTMLVNGTPPARPSAETCRYCPVRQLCDEYWGSRETAVLRLTGTATPAWGTLPTVFGDVRLTQLPVERRPDGAVVGLAFADGIGEVRVRIISELCPPTAEPVLGARILGGKLTTDGGEVVIATAAGTEIFWEQ